VDLRNNVPEKRDTAVLNISPPLSFVPLELLFNGRADLLCIVGRSQLVIIEITESMRRDLLTRRATQLNCRGIEVGSYFHNTNPNITNQRVLWHPLATTHLAVLTSDNTWRLYDAATDLEEAEQTFRLYRQLPQHNRGYYDDYFNTVDFCFGSTATRGWNCFTVFFLTEESEIYALCPVLPHRCLLPLSILSSLLIMSNQQLTQVKNELYQSQGHRHIEELEINQRRYTNQIQWLEEVKGKEEGVWIQTEIPKLKGKPVLQGPIDPNGEEYQSFERQGSCSLLSLNSCPQVLLRCSTSGLLDVFLSFDDLEPEWDPDDYFYKPTLLLYETVCLDLPVADLLDDEEEEWQRDWSSDVIQVPLLPRMSVYPIYNKYSVFVQSIKGLHLVNLPWLSSLEGCSDPADLDDLTTTSTDLLIDLFPSEAPQVKQVYGILGMCMNAGIRSDQQLLILDSEFRCRVLPLHYLVPSQEDIKTWLSLSVHKHSADELAEDEPGCNPSILPDQLAQLIQKKLPAVPKIQTQDPESQFSDPNCLRYLIAQSNNLTKNHIRHIHHLDAEISNRLTSISEMKDRQAATVKQIYGKLELQKAKSRDIANKLADAKKFQELLTKRSDILLDLINSQQPNLSTEEKQYHNYLKKTTHNLTYYHQKLDNLRNISEEVIQQNQKNKSDTPEMTQLKKYQPFLQKEVEMIRDLNEKVSSLSLEIEKYGN